MTSVGDPLVGQVLDGRYQITARLARGGMATVYQAVDTRLTRTVAVKVMHVGLGDDAEFARKFDREARAAARLSHPNVVAVFDQGQAMLDGHTVRPYIVMEYVEGPTLRDLIVREAPIPPLRALEVFEPMLAALAAAHDAGLVHRDVKPENVLISQRGQVKVADFGLAKAVSSQTSTATQGLLIGTVSYLPPELVVSGRADARSDVYSAGVVLFELLTGRKPHTGETPIQVAYAHVHSDVPAPSSVLPVSREAVRIPPYLDALVTSATARSADARPHDARVLLAQVRRVRTALLQGLADDQELTQDLSMVRAPADDADGEVTQLVPAAGPPPVPRPSPAAQAPPTVRYAPTPAAAAPAPAPAPRQAVAARAIDQQERQRRKRRRGWLALLLVLLLTAVVAFGVYYLTEGRFTTAPALATLSKAEAEQVADLAGLQLRTEEAYSETAPRGTVISTDPGPGAKIADGGPIEAVVSIGPERYPVPSVVGLSQSAARAALTAAHLSTGTVTQQWNETKPVGTVLAATPAAGSVAPQTPVALTVSRGPRPIKITDYSGKPADTVVKVLKRLGFKVVEKTEHSDTVAADLVLRQSPDSGSGAKGDTVTVTRSLGPVMVTIPNVRAMGIRAAEKVMNDAGFKTVVRPAAVNYLGLGYVVTTRPKIRSQAPKGSTITLYVV